MPPISKVVVEYVNADEVAPVTIETVFVSSDDDPIKVIFISEHPKVPAVVELPVEGGAVADSGPFGSRDDVLRIQRRIEATFILTRDVAERLVERLQDILEGGGGDEDEEGSE